MEVVVVGDDSVDVGASVNWWWAAVVVVVVGEDNSDFGGSVHGGHREDSNDIDPCCFYVLNLVVET